jgi:hypothetical protein
MRPPIVWIFTVCWNEAVMMPWFLRWYSSFAEQIIVWDEFSTDGTRDIVKTCPKAELRDWPYHGLDDNKFTFAVNNWYKEARLRADWVMWPDVDEILYHPDPRKHLAESHYACIPARGYAMISEAGPPYPTETGQIFDHVNMGVPQENYNKWLIWRPQCEVIHGIGRHDVPRVNGPISGEMDWKLLHYHYFGTRYTRARNARNYERAVDKKFAWNYAPAAAGHRGTPEWVESMISETRLQKIV